MEETHQAASPFGARSIAAVALTLASMALVAPIARAYDVPRPPGPNPDNRAYEMVSPVDKKSNDVNMTMSRTQAAPSGDRVAYTSLGGFGDIEGLGKMAQYVAERGPGGWTTRGLTPRQRSGPFTWAGFDTFIRILSPDLSKFAFRNSPGLTEGAPATNNLYVQDTADGENRLMTPVAPPGATGLYQPFLADVSADFSRVLFESTGALTPDAPDDGVTKVYESIDGELRLASVMPDGSPAPSEAGAGPSASILGFQYTNRFTQSSMSTDGSRIFFTVRDGGLEGRGQIYARIDGATTVHVNASKRSTPDPNGPQPAMFEYASNDGSVVLFHTTEQLVDDDVDDQHDLYRYDLDGDVLTRLSQDLEPADGSAAQVIGVLEADADASYVYFVTSGKLHTGAADPAAAYIYRWHDGENRYVGSLTSSDLSTAILTAASSGGTRFYTNGRGSRISPDGKHLFFRSSAPMLGYDNASHGQAYLYSDDDGGGTLRCASCRSDGGSATGDVLYQQYGNVAAFDPIEYQSRAVTDDGSRVYFTTDQSLVPEDVNGRLDAYEFDVAAGEKRLLSSGRSPDNSFFVDASADGKDVFIVTRERLSRWDVDNNRDLYDVRRDGGLPEPPKPAVDCDQDACQGPIGGRPALEQTGSDDFRGAGDVPSTRASFSVRDLTGRQRARLAEGGRATLTVKVSRRARVTVRATARLGGRRATVASASRVAARPGTVRLTLRLNGIGRKAVAQGDALRVRLVVRVSGVDRPRTLRLRLKGSK